MDKYLLPVKTQLNQVKYVTEHGQVLITCKTQLNQITYVTDSFYRQVLITCENSIKSNHISHM